jgi:hypothetical protein
MSDLRRENSRYSRQLATYQRHSLKPPTRLVGTQVCDKGQPTSVSLAFGLASVQPRNRSEFKTVPTLILGIITLA